MSKLTITGLLVGGIVGGVLLLITRDVGLMIVMFLAINIMVQTVRIAKKSNLD